MISLKDVMAFLHHSQPAAATDLMSLPLTQGNSCVRREAPAAARAAAAGRYDMGLRANIVLHPRHNKLHAVVFVCISNVVACTLNAMTGASAGRQRQLQAQRPPPADPGLATEGVPQVEIVLYPFTPSTDAEVAAALLLQHASYHLQLGVAKIIQYTQARPCSLP